MCNVRFKVRSDEIVVVMLSLFPHAVTLALGEAYDAVVQKWVRRMLALPLVPLQLFLRGTNGLAYLAVVDAAPPAIDQVKVQMVHQYLADVWIDMVESTFALFLWNHWQSGQPMPLKALLNNPHPNNNPRKSKCVQVDNSIANLKACFARGQIDLP